MTGCSALTRSLALLLPGLLLLGGTLASGEVLKRDTVWSGEVLVQEKVVVAKGSTLLLLPGTTVRFVPARDTTKGGGRLLVHGRLVAQGRPDAPILLTSAARQPAPGDWEGVRLEEADGEPSRLSRVRIEYARTGLLGHTSNLQAEQLVLTDNQIGLAGRSGFGGSLFGSSVRGNGIGVRLEQNELLRIVNCEIVANRQAGVYLLGSSPLLRDNRIIDNGEFGIAVLRGSFPVIEENRIEGQQKGIQAEMNASPAIRHNFLTRNEVAIGVERLSFPRIEQNVITGNRTGLFVHLGGYPQVNRNDIRDNQAAAIELGLYQSVEVARTLPFDRRLAMNLPLTGPGEEDQKHRPAPPELPERGLIDATGNWWGEEATLRLEEDPAPRNLALFSDGRDLETVDYNGATHPRDRVDYADWRRSPVPEAGPRPQLYPVISGVVRRQGAPVAGARVYLLVKGNDGVEPEGSSFTAPTGPDGRYSLQARPGSYRLVVRRQTTPWPAAFGPGADLVGTSEIEMPAVSALVLDLETEPPRTVSQP